MLLHQGHKRGRELVASSFTRHLQAPFRRGAASRAPYGRAPLNRRKWGLKNLQDFGEGPAAIAGSRRIGLCQSGVFSL
jgi:hypothetical protein